MDRKPKILQCEVSNSGQASDTNTDRCFTGRLGSPLHWYGDWGKWSVEERKLHINILELVAVKNAISAYTKKKKNQFNLYSHPQYNWAVRQKRN